LGVAHKTLPCGSKVSLRYHGHTIAVRVIDRGPYVAGRDFDLTEATRARLGFPGVGVLLSSR
jgi:rare lipoprotein A (peptidoglycan hydrolase)